MCQIPPRETTKLDEREFLPASWAGFGFDRDGLLITRSGYRCSPQSLESALWLVGCMRADARRLMIHSDEVANALRPLYETSDADDTGQVQPTKLRLVEDQKRFGGGAQEPTRSVQDARREVAQGEQRTPDQDQEHARTERGRQTAPAEDTPVQRLRRATAFAIGITDAAPARSSSLAALATSVPLRRSLGDYPLL